MNEPSPYERSEAAAYPEPVPVGPESIKPQALTMFGVIHLIMAGLGILSVGATVFSLVFTKQFMAGAPGNGEIAQIQANVAWVSYLSAGFSAVLVVMLVLAGVALLRSRRNALRLSNVYAYLSIGTKVVSAILALVVVAPATRQIMQATLPPEAAGMSGGFVSIVSTLSSVLGPLVACTYPVLAIVLLNRPHIKAWLENFGR